MSSKKKLIVTISVMLFILLTVVATIAIVFAATQQTVKTSLNISYNAQDLDGSVYAKYSIGNYEAYLTPDAIDANHISADGNSLVFKASDKEPAGNLMFPEEALALDSKNDNVVIQYTYSNTGSKHYIATMDFDANIVAENMKVEYSIDGLKYEYQRYAVVVPANTSNVNYWIKISIDNKAKDASFTVDFNWLLEGCNMQDEAYLSIPSYQFQATENVGEYKVRLVNLGDYGTRLVIPRSINGDKVTTIVESGLTPAEKAMITRVQIPDSVTTIGEKAFEGFANLEKVTFKQNGTSGVVSVASSTGLEEIDSYAFRNCVTLTEFEIPNSVTYVGVDAFWGCAGLSNLTIGRDVFGLFSDTFGQCANLTNITLNSTNSSVLTVIKNLTRTNGTMNLTIGDCVEILDNSAFSDWEGLTNLTISNSVRSIGNAAFYDCSDLISVKLSDNITKIAGSVFAGCSSLASITIPNGVETIEQAAFSGCENLTSIDIPDSVTSIELYTFRGCVELKSVKIGDGVESLGEEVFYNCSNLTDVTLGNNVTIIGERAFYKCSSLKNVTFKNAEGWIAQDIQGGFGGGSVSLSLPDFDLSNTETAASLLRGLPYYTFYQWTRTTSTN